MRLHSSRCCDKHNRHHANPNHIDKDPDVVADILVFTSEQARGGPVSGAG